MVHQSMSSSNIYSWKVSEFPKKNQTLAIKKKLIIFSFAFLSKNYKLLCNKLNRIELCKHNGTRRRSGISQHILTCQLRSKKIYTSKVFIDIWSLIGYIIDTFENTAQDFYRNVVQKSWNKRRTCHSVWYWKIYSVNHFFVDSPFCDQMFKALKHWTTWINEQYSVSTKTLHVRN